LPVRTAHFWTETHPELSIEPDMRSVLDKHEVLARLLLDPSDAERVKAGEALRRTLAELGDVKASLRVSSEALELALVSGGQYVWEIDCGTRVMKIIGDPRSVFGFDVSRAEEERFAHVHPEDLPYVRDACEAMFAGKGPRRVEHRVINPTTGETSWAHWSGRLVTESGRAKLVGITRNITSRKNAELKRNEVETALRESKEQFRWLASIVEFSDDAIVSKNLDGVITSWNKGAERLFGYVAEEVIGKPVTILTPSDRQNEECAILERIRRGDRIDHYETIRRRKDGNLIDVSLTVSPMRDAEGNIVGASKIARDITERKQELELLRRQADLLDQSHDAIFTWKIGGGIMFWSKGAERLYGYTAEEAIGRVSHELLRTRSSIPMQEVESQIAREGSWYGELTHTTREGCTVAVESRHVRVEYSGETYALETNRDITERKRSEAQISTLAREAEHRAKNLLSNVRAMVQLSQADTPAGLKEAIAGRIEALANVHSLFVNSRWTGAELASLVKQELSPYSRDGEMRTQIDEPTVMLKPDLPQAIAVALHELATNAAKYGALSVANGQVCVEWSRTADGQLVLRWTEAGGPPVKPPTRRGFGTSVMESMIRDGMKGRAQLDWRAEGLACEIAVPT
jgi:PAS domain S-box-containing protein